MLFENGLPKFEESRCFLLTRKHKQICEIHFTFSVRPLTSCCLLITITLQRHLIVVEYLAAKMMENLN